MIPKNVIDVLSNIRASAAINMLNRRGVIIIADVFDEEAADWLRANENLYMDALTEVGTRVNKEQEE